MARRLGTGTGSGRARFHGEHSGGSGLFLLDTFTDNDGVLLTAHAPEVGVAWNPVYGSSASPTIANNRLHGNGTVTAEYMVSTGLAPSADYSVAGQFTYLTGIGGDMIGVLGRVSTDAQTWYKFDYYGGAFRLVKRVDGVDEILASFPLIPSAGDTKTITLTMVGTSIVGYLDGAPIASAVNGAIVAAGHPGLVTRYSTPTTGCVLDWIQADAA